MNPPQDDPLANFLGELRDDAAKRDAGPEPTSMLANPADAAAGAASSADAARAAEDQLLASVQRKTKVTKVLTDARKAQADAVAQEQKQREDQYKSFARAVKVSAEAEAAAEIEEDTPELRHDALRKYGLLREMGVPGTRARITADTPLVKIKAEISVMNSQLDLERAVGMPEEMLKGAISAAEYGCLPMGIDIRGLSDDFGALLEDSRTSRDPIDKHLDRAMMQMSIKYSSYFAMGPEMYVATLLLRMGRTRMARNAAARANRDVSDELAKQFAAIDEEDDDLAAALGGGEGDGDE